MTDEQIARLERMFQGLLEGQRALGAKIENVEREVRGVADGVLGLTERVEKLEPLPERMDRVELRLGAIESHLTTSVEPRLVGIENRLENTIEPRLAGIENQLRNGVRKPPARRKSRKR